MQIVAIENATAGRLCRLFSKGSAGMDSRAYDDEVDQVQHQQVRADVSTATARPRHPLRGRNVRVEDATPDRHADRTGTRAGNTADKAAVLDNA